jgi:chemotaxis response regulator CheB
MNGQKPYRTPNEVAMVKRVIIVDDNPGVRKLLCEAFTIGGDFSVCGEAANGTEAIEKAQLPALYISPRQLLEGEGKDMVPERPLCDVIIFGLGMGSTQPLLVGARRGGR